MLTGGLKCEKKEIVLPLEDEHPAKFPVRARKRVLERKRARNKGSWRERTSKSALTVWR